ncbi:signal peptidase I [Latilactobacillus graminis]|uniref:Signal peptidase I n=2 Tax=Latilactobacillus graminis TaxID=60519 RepID=A0AA89I1L8_9LACO|nr:signal peptidase I [Latilactobacillus graminis]KRM21966.1 signal peptidase I [Latilactobacillus graminis DSM 20719]QFP79654.1 signal peptidase I [Latilactobacillus graminis]
MILPKQKLRRGSAIIGYWILAILLAGTLAIVIRSFVLVPASVAGQSMAPNLKSADQLLLRTSGPIKRFDIVVFKRSDHVTYVKRVIGLPGETVAYRNDRLYVNGRYVTEPFLNQVKRKTGILTSDFELKALMGEYQIPANEYFVLGDNRQISKDSRLFGTIHRDTILGRAVAVYYPLHDIQRLK